MTADRADDSSGSAIRLVEATRRGTAIVLALSGLDAKGMFTTQLLDELSEQVARVHDDASTRILILTGSGGRFCAGGNIGNAPDGRERFAQAFARALQALADCRLPVIAVVDGRCTAGGMTLLGAADYAFSTPDATFGYSELAVGAFPMLALVTMPAHLPKKTFFEWVYTAKMVSAEEMRARDLVNRVVEADRLWDEVDRFTASLSDMSATAIAMGRRLYHSTLGAIRTAEIEAATRAVSALPAVAHYQESSR